jgi:hypothetical protein
MRDRARCDSVVARFKLLEHPVRQNSVKKQHACRPEQGEEDEENALHEPTLCPSTRPVYYNCPLLLEVFF